LASHSARSLFDKNLESAKSVGSQKSRRQQLSAWGDGMTSARGNALYRYKAFISYSHGADNRLAPALRTALHGFAKPWYRLRAMRVFRDETGLAITSALWPSIEAALLDSEYFLLLASPDAAASEWVQREVACWLDRRPADHLLIALTHGEIRWNDAVHDFDWNGTDALPPRLSKAFDQVPKYVDLRWARMATDLSLRNPDFLTAVASVASTLQGQPLDELVGEDVRQHRRTRRVAAAAIVGLATLAVAATVFGVIASQQRDEARRQEQIAIRQEQIAVEQKQVATEQRDQARRRLVQLNVANGSRAADAGDASAALLWFTEAAKLEADHPIEQSLLRTRLASLAGRHPRLAQVWSATAPIVPFGGVGFTPDGAWVVVYPLEGSVQAWDAQTASAAFKPLSSSVIDIAVTPQGRRLLTVDTDGANLWDTLTGEQVRSLAHDTPVSLARFTADGQHVFTLTEDHTARVWDADAGREIAGLQDVDEIFDAAVDGDMVTLLIRSPGNELALWDSRTQQSVAFDKHNVVAAELSADRRYVLTRDDDKVAAVWDGQTGRQVTSLGDWQGVNHTHLSPDGQRVVMALQDGRALIWDIVTDREVQTLQHQGAVLGAAFSPDGKRLATASTDQQAHVWDIEAGKEVSPPLWHEAIVSGVAFSPDGKRLSTATGNDVVRLWDLAGAPGVTLPHQESVRFAAFSPDGTRVLTATNFTAQLWDAIGTTGKAAFVWTPGAQIYHATFSPDGAYALTASTDHFARLWDVKTGKETAALSHPRDVSYAAFSRDGKRLLTASAELLLVWDVAALPQIPSEPKVSLTHDELVLYGEFSADGREILGVDFGGTARVWNVETAQERTELRRSEITLARLSPDGRRMATAGVDRVLRIWDTATGALVGQLVAHEHRMTVVAFSPDGRRVVTADEERVRIWDTESGGAVTPPMRHNDLVMHAVFSADGTRVLTASRDGTARVWNAASGQPITDPLEHRWMVRYAAFSPDGQQVVTASEDRTARLWSLSPGSVDAEGWRRRAQLLAARRIDETGAVVTIDTAPFLDLWENANHQP
jgi:WD40 repeat protein